MSQKILCCLFNLYFKKMLILMATYLTSIAFMYNTVVLGQQRCYFRTEVNQSHISLTIQCWNDSMSSPQQLVLYSNVSPILHIVTYPTWWSLSSMISINTHSFMQTSSCSIQDSSNCSQWTLSMNHLNQSCSLIRTIPQVVSEQSTIIESDNVIVCPYEAITVSPCSMLSLCVEVDRFSLSSTTTVALVRNSSSYYITYYESDNERWSGFIAVPSCLPTDSSLLLSETVLYWSIINVIDCNNFIPSSVYIASIVNVFVLSRDAIIYSPNKGGIFYYLSLPNDTSSLTSFNISTDGNQFVLTTVNNNTEYRVWFGIVGSEVISVYPSLIMDTILGMRRQVGLFHWNQYGSLLMETNTSVKIPLFLILKEAISNHSLIYNSSFIIPHILFGSQSSQYFQLTSWSVATHHNFSCPFVAVNVLSPICSKYTRIRLIGNSSNLTNQFDDYRLSYSNCSRLCVNELPKVIFLSLGGVFRFSILFSLRYFDESALHFTIQTSTPNIINLSTSTSWNTETNVKEVKVTIKESLINQQQVTTGVALNSTLVTMQVLTPGLLTCVQEKLQEQILIPSKHRLSVSVGCPPGLLFVFDYHESIAGENHYCEFNNCLYFENIFSPVFQIEDTVTRLRKQYVGNYSLQAKAGGTSQHNMIDFPPNTIESVLWEPIDEYSNGTTFSTTKNGIRWLCARGSPCNDLLPKTRGTPEYILLLEASNMGFPGSYCNFTVTFTVHIHGIKRGARSIVMQLTITLVVFCTCHVIGFLVWSKWNIIKEQIHKAKARFENNFDHIITSIKGLINQRRNKIVPSDVT